MVCGSDDLTSSGLGTGNCNLVCVQLNV
uniref:Uncharacterized protein n=1 Tax=Anguilla anguilla TaxID=7936 RepID=A0A0E9S5N1_ANGAN